MPLHIELPSKQADGVTPNYVDLRDPDDFTAGELFAIHRQVRIKTGEASYSPRELEDDQVNAFLSAAITGWSFGPTPKDVNVAAGDVVIGKAMKARDWGVLRRKAAPLMEELEGFGAEDPKEPASS
jgi:hypothetical protein